MPFNGDRVRASTRQNPLATTDLDLFSAPDGPPADPSTWYTHEQTAETVTITHWMHIHGVTYQLACAVFDA